MGLVIVCLYFGLQCEKLFVGGFMIIGGESGASRLYAISIWSTRYINLEQMKDLFCSRRQEQPLVNDSSRSRMRRLLGGSSRRTRNQAAKSEGSIQGTGCYEEERAGQKKKTGQKSLRARHQALHKLATCQAVPYVQV